MSSIAQSARALIALRPNCLLEGDSFRLSVILLIILSVAQRLIGLTRNVIFCGMLEDHELGRWSLINNFFCWAAPFVVIGLPGSFGRLSESYRQRGELRHFIMKTGRVCGILAAVAAVFHLLAPQAIAKLVFNDPQQKSIVIILGAV